MRLEIIGDNYRWAARHNLAHTPLRQQIAAIRYGRQELRPWVARLAGIVGDRFQREFITGMRDYTLARGTGMRGVYEYWPLPEGLYEVNECVRLGVNRRYFIRVVGTEITEVAREEVVQWLENAISA